ncbi:MAG: endolytic transglycosylase MltG [Desulfuromonadales bacterium]|nr:endolytic transglycosylase MltG [Desulfuromonadales bacterium]
MKKTSQKQLKLYLPLAVAISFILFISFLFMPPGDGENAKVVELKQGESLYQFAKELKNEKIIRSPILFTLYTKISERGRKVQSGVYKFTDGMNLATISHKLITGDVYENRFSVPEGYSIFQLAELLENKGFCKKENFLRACTDQELLKELGIKGTSVEGYLYPSTYNLTGLSSPEDLIRAMVKQFNKIYEKKFSGAEARSRLSRNEILTLASMIEKEAIVPEEKPLISSVFHNRLKKKMRLQSDPTAIYGVRAFGGKVYKQDILTKTPYNTYWIKGLPPGPIGNPPADAIYAALNPANTDYYYFVARKDGTHQFSRSLKEHNQAVDYYLK